MTRPLDLPEPQATAALGAALAAVLPERYAGWTVLLAGELGAGKSTLARALILALGHTGHVPSPTYTLVEPYELPRGTVYHVDLYRIADPDELEYLGWSDLGDGLLLIEWPERAPALAARADLAVELTYAGSGRRAVVRALSERAGAVAAALADRVR